jgi:hypothetical protein
VGLIYALVLVDRFDTLPLITANDRDDWDSYFMRTMAIANAFDALRDVSQHFDVELR